MDSIRMVSADEMIDLETGSDVSDTEEPSYWRLCCSAFWSKRRVVVIGLGILFNTVGSACIYMSGISEDHGNIPHAKIYGGIGAASFFGNLILREMVD